MSKKIFITIGVIAVVAIGVVVWLNKDKKQEMITIGAILPLTGQVSFTGVPIKNSIELFINEFNSTSNTKVNVIYEDSQGDKNKAISAFQKLQLQGIKIIIGPVTSGEVLTVAPLAEKHQIVIFSPGSSASEITNFGEYVFRNELSDVYGAKEQARLAIDILHWKNVGVLYIQNDYGVGIANAFENEFKQRGGVIPISLAFASNTTDFRTHIMKYKNQQLNAIFIIAQAEYPQIVKQIRENDLRFNLYATPVFEDNTFLEQIGKANSEGIIYTYYGAFDLENTDRESKSFIENYQVQYKIAPSYYAALGYDNVSIVVEILKKNEFKFENINKEFYAGKNFKGITGNISFDKNGDVIKPVTLKIVKDGKFVKYNSINKL
ncbi:MAG: penicillin-binding protein activator [Bacteroidales bacterium]|jgi:branched-chain amino acid transport system substrate-binding protein|nr:penicillin-binding protein activator [Bacteroidales bacterium]